MLSSDIIGQSWKIENPTRIAIFGLPTQIGSSLQPCRPFSSITTSSQRRCLTQTSTKPMATSRPIKSMLTPWAPVEQATVQLPASLCRCCCCYEDLEAPCCCPGIFACCRIRLLHGGGKHKVPNRQPIVKRIICINLLQPIAPFFLYSLIFHWTLVRPHIKTFPKSISK